MQAIILSGSRNPTGQTAHAAQALLAGLTAAGATGEIVYLPECAIERCRQCDAAGWGTCRTAGSCVIADDLAGLADRIRQADLAVFATPVYWSDLSESLRAFLDRLRRCCLHESAKPGIAGKRAVGICVAGGGGGGAPTCAVSLERILRTCGFDLVDVLPVRRQNLAAKCDELQVLGRWLATAEQS